MASWSVTMQSRDVYSSVTSTTD